MADPVLLPIRFRPFGARMASGLAAVVLVAAITFLWMMLPGEVQDDFGIGQRVTLILFFLAVLILLNALFRTSATADESGLTIVNGYKKRHYDWPEVIKVTLTPHRPWALLDLAEGDTVSVMAIQVSDGSRARTAAHELATVLEQQSRTERND
jgi:hypothetical protein